MTRLGQFTDDELAAELAKRGGTDWRALADDLAAFIAKPVRAYVVRVLGTETPTYTVEFTAEWKAERDAVLARYREASQR
jgi:hypothetical protein